MGYFPLLLSAERDWQAIGRRLGPKAARARTVYINEQSALGWAWARLLARLDAFDRLRFELTTEMGEPGAKWVVEHPVTHVRATGATALAECLAALPCGLPFSWFARMPIVRPLVDRVGRLVVANEDSIAGGLRLGPPGDRPSGEGREPIPARAWLYRRASEARELAALTLLVAVTSQLLVENHAIPQRYKFPQPEVDHPARRVSAPSAGLADVLGGRAHGRTPALRRRSDVRRPAR